MAYNADQRGVYQEINIITEIASILGVTNEPIQNRRHGKNKNGIQFAFIRCVVTDCYDNENTMFILASSQERSKESVVKEFTPFNYKSDNKQKNRASLGTHGIGANLFHFKMGGILNMIFSDDKKCDLQRNRNYRIENINITDLVNNIYNENKNLSRFNPEIYEPSEATNVPLFTVSKEFKDDKGSQLIEFLNTIGFKTYYTYTNPFKSNQEFYDKGKWDEYITNIAKMYEHNILNKDITFYTSWNLEKPSPLSISSPDKSLHLHSKYMSHQLVFHWYIKDTGNNSYEKYFKLNGITYKINEKLSTRKTGKQETRYECTPYSDIESEFITHFRIIIGILKPEYRKYTKIGEKIYIFLEGDLLSDDPGDSNCGRYIRNLKGGAMAYRIQLHLDHRDVKEKEYMGFLAQLYKFSSTITSKGAIYSALQRTLTYINSSSAEIMLNGTPDIINQEMSTILNQRERHKTNSKKRSKEGMKYDGRINTILRERFDESYTDITFYEGDANVTKSLEIDGQGIDSLAILRYDNIIITVQIKDKKVITPEEVVKYVNSIDEVRDLKNNYKFINFLISRHTIPINKELSKLLAVNDIIVLCGEKTLNVDDDADAICNDIFDILESKDIDI